MFTTLLGGGRVRAGRPSHWASAVVMSSPARGGGTHPSPRHSPARLRTALPCTARADGAGSPAHLHCACAVAVQPCFRLSPGCTAILGAAPSQQFTPAQQLAASQWLAAAAVGHGPIVGHSSCPQHSSWPQGTQSVLSARGSLSCCLPHPQQALPSDIATTPPDLHSTWPVATTTPVRTPTFAT
jgi:hypothetical protein